MLWHWISDFNFWGPFWRLRFWGLKTRPKSWPTLGSFWVTCYLKIVFPNFQTLDPPLKVKTNTGVFLRGYKPPNALIQELSKVVVVRVAGPPAGHTQGWKQPLSFRTSSPRTMIGRASMGNKYYLMKYRNNQNIRSHTGIFNWVVQFHTLSQQSWVGLCVINPRSILHEGFIV